jgi:hypothetical protein
MLVMQISMTAQMVLQTGKQSGRAVASSIAVKHMVVPVEQSQNSMTARHTLLVGHRINELGVVLIMVWHVETGKLRVIVFSGFEMHFTANTLITSLRTQRWSLDNENVV